MIYPKINKTIHDKNYLNSTTIETERLILRTLKAEDDGIFYDYLMRNYDFFKPWSPEYDNQYRNKDTFKARIGYLVKEEIEGRTIKFALFKKEDSSKIIGTIVLSNIVRGPFLSCYLGYRIDGEENGKGYATESIGKVVEYAFSSLKLHRVEANIIPRNKASIRVVEKLGFNCEGLSHKYLKINGVWEDHLHYVKINDDI